jgi:hypothetical protein
MDNLKHQLRQALEPAGSPAMKGKTSSITSPAQGKPSTSQRAASSQPDSGTPKYKLKKLTRWVSDDSHDSGAVGEGVAAVAAEGAEDTGPLSIQESRFRQEVKSRLRTDSGNLMTGQILVASWPESSTDFVGAQRAADGGGEAGAGGGGKAGDADGGGGGEAGDRASAAGGDGSKPTKAPPAAGGKGKDKKRPRVSSTGRPMKRPAAAQTDACDDHALEGGVRLPDDHGGKGESAPGGGDELPDDHGGKSKGGESKGGGGKDANKAAEKAPAHKRPAADMESAESAPGRCDELPDDHVGKGKGGEGKGGEGKDVNKAAENAPARKRPAAAMESAMSKKKRRAQRLSETGCNLDSEEHLSSASASRSASPESEDWTGFRSAGSPPSSSKEGAGADEGAGKEVCAEGGHDEGQEAGDAKGEGEEEEKETENGNPSIKVIKCMEWPIGTKHVMAYTELMHWMLDQQMNQQLQPSLAFFGMKLSGNLYTCADIDSTIALGRQVLNVTTSTPETKVGFKLEKRKQKNNKPYLIVLTCKTVTKSIHDPDAPIKNEQMGSVALFPDASGKFSHFYALRVFLAWRSIVHTISECCQVNEKPLSSMIDDLCTQVKQFEKHTAKPFAVF